MIGGFGEAGSPVELIHALIDQGAKDLTVISNNTGSGEVGLAALLKARRVTKVICSFPKTANSTVFPELYREGFTELELVPQGTLAERIRAGGAGVHAFYTPTASARRWPRARRAACSTGGSTARVRADGRLRADQGAHRRHARERAVQQDGAELRPADGDGGAGHDRAGARSSTRAGSTRRRS
jgi:acyl CoA:acetate/3-ketoacid CoA transferase alpha subunit